jgi:hypothetical protein
MLSQWRLWPVTLRHLRGQGIEEEESAVSGSGRYAERRSSHLRRG